MKDIHQVNFEPVHTIDNSLKKIWKLKKKKEKSMLNRLKNWIKRIF